MTCSWNRLDALLYIWIHVQNNDQLISQRWRLWRWRWWRRRLWRWRWRRWWRRRLWRWRWRRWWRRWCKQIFTGLYIRRRKSYFASFVHNVMNQRQQFFAFDVSVAVLSQTIDSSKTLKYDQTMLTLSYKRLISRWLPGVVNGENSFFQLQKLIFSNTLYKQNSLDRHLCQWRLQCPPSTERRVHCSAVSPSLWGHSVHLVVVTVSTLGIRFGLEHL